MKALLISLLVLLGGCASFWDHVVMRPPTACEKLCDRFFVPGSATLPDGPNACVCYYKDQFHDDMEKHLPRIAPRFSQTGTARITCTPDCATAASRLK